MLTVGEITKGVELIAEGRRRRELARWVAEDLPALFVHRIVGIDQNVGLEWGQLSARRLREGRALPVIDGLLLGTASVHRLTLVTRNLSDCGRLGVAVLDPGERTT